MSDNINIIWRRLALFAELA